MLAERCSYLLGCPVAVAEPPVADRLDSHHRSSSSPPCCAAGRSTVVRSLADALRSAQEELGDPSLQLRPPPLDDSRLEAIHVVAERQPQLVLTPARCFGQLLRARRVRLLCTAQGRRADSLQTCTQRAGAPQDVDETQSSSCSNRCVSKSFSLSVCRSDPRTSEARLRRTRCGGTCRRDLHRLASQSARPSLLGDQMQPPPGRLTPQH